MAWATHDLASTTFSNRLWRALRQVRYGRTTTYGPLARELGITDSGSLVTGSRPVSGAQKVAWAIAGSLIGYLGGMRRKQALLDFEAAGGEPDTLRHRDAQQLALP
jgi:methylated-DNA-[protein]-cysteine S-methyltransferase